MRPNIWIVVGILIVLFAMTRYLRDQKTLQICVDDPTASLCQRRLSQPASRNQFPSSRLASHPSRLSESSSLNLTG